MMIHRVWTRLGRSEPRSTQNGPQKRAVSPRATRRGVLTVVVAGGVVALCLAGWYWLADVRMFWDGIRPNVASADAFRVWVAGFGAWAPMVFFLAVAAQVIVAPIPGSIFPPVATAAFGPAAGVALVTGGTAMGAALVFALTRRWGRPLASRLVGPAALDRYAGLVTAHGGLWLFLIYLLPLLPDDAVSAAAGLSKISFRRFLLLSTVGRLPGTVASVYTASLLFAGPLWVWLALAIATSVGALLAVRYHASMETWLVSRIGKVRQ